LQVRGPRFLSRGPGQRGRAAAVAAFRLGRGDPLGGQLVLQVALELADGDEHVDDQVGGRVVGRQVGEVGQRARQDPQRNAAGLAPVADGLDVGQVPAEPEQLRDGQGVAGVRGGGDPAERGPAQRGDLGGGRGVLVEPHAAGRAEAPATSPARTSSPASVRMCRCRSRDWEAVDARA
jgi:hypothetical protein